jgi:chromosome segregation ATPase
MSQPTTGTTGSGSAPIAVDPYENWASPEEVLQFRTLWESSKTKYAQEAADLRRRLVQTEKERDALFEELRDTERLRDQYRTARSSFEAVRQEKSHWMEEREMLMLRLQRMANEIDRLRNSRAAGGAAGASTNSNVSLGISSPSRTPSWGSSQPSSLLSMTTAEETVRLLEELHRQSLLASAMEQRFELQALVTSFEVERFHRMHLLTVGENEMLRSKVRIMSDADDETRRSLRFSQQEANALKDELASAEIKRQQLEDKRAMELQDVERNWEALWKDDIQEKEKRWRLREDDLAEQVQVLQEEKHALERKRDEAVLTKNALVDQSQAEVAELEAELANHKTQLTEMRVALREAEQLRVQQAAVTSDEVRTLVISRGDSERKYTVAQNSLEAVQRDLHEMKMHNEQQGIAIAKLLSRNAELSKIADHIKTIEGERDAYKLRAVSLDEELAVQQEFYEKQLRVSHGAFNTLQKQKRAESDAVLREMVVLRSDMGRRKPRAATKCAADLPPASDAMVQVEEGNARSAAAIPNFGGGPQLDALSVLREAKVLADRLQGSVMRSAA